MQFRLMENPDFHRILCDVHRLSPYQCMDTAGLPFFRTVNPMAAKNIFSLPLGFYYTAEQLKERNLDKIWQRLSSISQDEGMNFSICSVGDAGLEGGVHVAHNPILDLSESKDNHRSSYRRNHVKNLNKENNKAKREGVTVKFAHCEAEIKGFYDVLARQYVREHHMLFQPYRLYQQLIEQGFGTDLVAKKDNKVVGGVFLLKDGDVLHYSWGARARVGNLNVSYLLLDAAIEYAVYEGYRFFDFGSTPLSDEALLWFKLKWGAEDIPVYKYATLANQGVTDLNNAYRGARRLFSFTPLPIAKAIMPIVVPWVISG